MGGVEWSEGEGGACDGGGDGGGGVVVALITWSQF